MLEKIVLTWPTVKKDFVLIGKINIYIFSFFLPFLSVYNLITTILVIIFWDFTIFYYRSDSPQVKGNLISLIANLVYKLRLIRMDTAKCLVSLQDLRLCKQQLKDTQKQIPNFSFTVQFYRITPFVTNILSGIVVLQSLQHPFILIRRFQPKSFRL